MRLKVWFGVLALVAAGITAGCGNGQVIGSAPLPTPTPIPTGVTDEITIGSLNTNPADIVQGNDGNLYFTEGGTNKIGSYNVTDKIFAQYTPATANAGVLGITVGPDSDIWFTESLADKVATISTGQVHEFVAGVNTQPAYITAGPGLFVFYTAPGVNGIGAFSTQTDLASGPYTIPTANSGPNGIVAGPDNNIWFTEYNAGKIGRLNTVTLTVDEEFALPAGSKNPDQIRLGPDGALWFTENNPAGPKLGRISTATGTITEFPLTGAASATFLSVGLDNDFYFTDPTNNAIGSFSTTTLKTAEYKIPTANSIPSGLTIGPDGRLYFGEHATNKIGQFNY